MTTIPTLLALSLSFLALCGSIVALTVALRTSGRSLSRRYIALSERLSELETAMEAQQGRMKSLSVRLSSVRRANGEAPEAPAAMTEAQKDEWQRQTNLQIARGLFRVR